MIKLTNKQVSEKLHMLSLIIFILATTHLYTHCIVHTITSITCNVTFQQVVGEITPVKNCQKLTFGRDTGL